MPDSGLGIYWESRGRNLQTTPDRLGPVGHKDSGAWRSGDTRQRRCRGSQTSTRYPSDTTNSSSARSSPSCGDPPSTSIIPPPPRVCPAQINSSAKAFSFRAHQCRSMPHRGMVAPRACPQSGQVIRGADTPSVTEDHGTVNRATKKRNEQFIVEQAPQFRATGPGVHRTRGEPDQLILV